MIGIISDTHDNVQNIKTAVEVFKKLNVEFVIHLGDIIAPASVQFFKGLKMKFLKGNCDGDIEVLGEKIRQIGGEFFLDKIELEIEGKKMICTHKPREELMTSGEYDYVLHGHTHVKRNDLRGKTRIINPGAHYYGGENTIAVLDPEKDKLEFIEVA